jgi:hypothetical protein
VSKKVSNNTWEALRLWTFGYGPFMGTAAEIAAGVRQQVQPGLILIHPERLDGQRVVMYYEEAQDGAGGLEYTVPDGARPEGPACALLWCAGYVKGDPRHPAAWVKEVHGGSRLVFDGMAHFKDGRLRLIGKCHWPRVADLAQAAFFGSDQEQADRDDAEEAIWPVTVTDILEKSQEV